jgi:hypothetical protein
VKIRLGDLTPIPEHYFDFLPTGKDTVLLFLLSKGKMVVWQGRGQLVDKRKEIAIGRDAWEISWSKEPMATLTPAFLEWFQVYPGKDGGFLFLTESGKLYSSPKPEKGEGKIEASWTDEKRPIRAVVADTAGGKEFAFAPPAGKEGEPVYFELAARVQPRKFDPKNIKPVALEDPLKTVLEYTQVLRADKQIK